MRKALLVIAIALQAASASAQSPAPTIPGHEPGEEKAVLGTLDRYIEAISANDLAGMKALLTPEGMTYRARPRADGQFEIVAASNAYWVAPERDVGRAVRERYWQPTVLIRGPIALVWAPYEFWVDGKTSHCGVDVFDFVKIDGQWRVSNSMWTVEPEACESLRPVDAAEVRPRR